MNLEIIKNEISSLKACNEELERCREYVAKAFVEKNFLENTTIINALEKQIPKKPYKTREHKQNDYYCTVCKRYLGDEMELKYACLQPEYCQHCGQKLLWESDTE